MKRLGFSRDVLASAGLLAREGQGGGLFWGRVMFPIKNARGQAIGFGGRHIVDVKEGAPKYLNTPETEIFRKREALYGIDVALPAASRLGQMIVVEGYLDRIAMSRHGYHNTIAAQGSSIDFSTIRRLMPIATEKIILFDGDRAGQIAHDRIVDAALVDAAPDSATRFAKLGGGHDPDSFLLENGRAEMDTLLGAAIPLEEALWQRTTRRVGRDGGPEARSAIVEELIRSAETIAHAETREWFHTVLADRVDREFGPRRRLQDLL